MKKYLDGMRNIFKKGFLKKSRTGTDIISTFGALKRYDLRDYQLPAVTTKKLFFRSFIHETLWFISGSVMLKYLKDHGISIWDSWVDKTTAVYADKDYEELDKEIRKKMGWGGDSITLEVFNVADPKFEGFAMSSKNYTVDLGYNNPVVFIPQETWETFHDGEHGSAAHAVFENAMQWLAKECEVEIQKLVDGSIGEGAYGQMWRRIEDTRRVAGDKLSFYVKKGFSFVTSVVGDTKTISDAIVTRQIDQLQNAINLLRTNPDSRRILICAFDPRYVDFCQLPPCHSFFQLWSREFTFEERLVWASKHEPDVYENFLQDKNFDDLPEEKEPALHEWLTRNGVPVRALSLLIYLRSNDAPVGEPFNTAQYGLLAHMIAQVTGHVAEELIYVNGDHHIYTDQVDLVNVQLEREPIEQTTTVKLNRNVKEIDDFKFEDIEIVGYNVCHPRIDYPVAV